MNRDEIKQLCVENDISHRNMDGKTLRALRDSLNLTREAMAEKLGITASAIWKLESGENKMSKRTEKLLHYVEMESRLQEYNSHN